MAGWPRLNTSRHGGALGGRCAFVMLVSALLECATRALATRLGAPLAFNRGVAFGMLRGRPGWAVLLSGGALALLLGDVFLSRGPRPARLALSAAAGGAAANLIQRLTDGAVTDWIPLPLSEALVEGGLCFNLADLEIALGTAAAFWVIVGDGSR